MELRRLRYFVVLAEELHFGRTAARLNVVQPAISQQIRLLEEDLGVQLVERSSKKVALTYSGRAFLPEARRAIEQMEYARRTARDAEAGLVGRLAIGFVDNAIWSVLPPIIRSFRAQFPRVELDLQQLNRTGQLVALTAGDLDVGVLPGPVLQASINSRLLRSAPLDVALMQGHPLCVLETVPILALADEPFVSFPSAADPRRIDELILSMCSDAGFTPIFGQATQQMHTSLALVSAGLGVAVVPRWMRPAGAHGVEYRPLAPPQQYNLMLATRIGRPLRTITSFLEVATQGADIEE